MQSSTKKKINDIRNLINKGISEKEIIKLKFKGSPKSHKNWMDKFGEYLDPQESEYFVTNVNDRFLPNDIELKKLKILLDNTDDLISLLNKEKVSDTYNIHILSVPEELIKLKDIKLASVRISEKIEKDFNDLVSKNKIYSKTSLLNLALLEFINKYK